MTQTQEIQTAPRQEVATRKFDPYAPIGDANGLKALMNSQRDSLAMMLPKHITPERLFKTMLVASNKTPDIYQCTQSSIVETINRAAELGLDLSGTLGEAYPVPFNNKIKIRTDRGTEERFVKQLQLIIGYRGYEKLAWQSGLVEHIDAEMVHIKDRFVFKKGTTVLVEFEPFMEGDRGDAIGAYAVVKIKGGGVLARFLAVDDIEKIRKSSKSADSPAWRNWWDEMGRKCALKRTLKDAPLSTEKMTKAMEWDSEDFSDVIEAAIDRKMIGSESRTDALNHKLAYRVTKRPVDDGKKFDPAADAVDQISAQNADAAPVDRASGLRDQVAQNDAKDDSGGAEADNATAKPVIPRPSGASMLKWARKDENDTPGVHDVICDAAMMLGVDAMVLNDWLKEPAIAPIVAKIKGNKASMDVCRKLVADFAEKFGGTVAIA